MSLSWHRRGIPVVAAAQALVRQAGGSRSRARTWAYLRSTTAASPVVAAYYERVRNAIALRREPMMEWDGRIRATSRDRVECRCPDGRPERVRGVAFQSEDGTWSAYAFQHGPGTDCGGPGPETWSYREMVRKSKKEVEDFLRECCGMEPEA